MPVKVWAIYAFIGGIISVEGCAKNHITEQFRTIKNCFQGIQAPPDCLGLHEISICDDTPSPSAYDQAMGECFNGTIVATPLSNKRGVKRTYSHAYLVRALEKECHKEHSFLFSSFIGA